MKLRGRVTVMMETEVQCERNQTMLKSALI